MTDEGPPGDTPATRDALSGLPADGYDASTHTSAESQTRYSASIYAAPSRHIPTELGEGIQDLERAMDKEVWLLVQARTGDYDILDQSIRQMFFSARDSLPTNKIILMVDSPGGDPRAAYQLATFLRRHCGGFIAVVPRRAKSAATLLSLGADEIILGDYGELGPLDMQLYDPEREGLASALDEAQALYRLSAFAMDAFDETMSRMLGSFPKKTEDLIPFAISIALGLTRPLLEDLDTVHYTYVSRELKLAQEYAIRLLRYHYEEEEANRIAHHLVENYFDHGFVIDAEEAARFGLRTVKQPSEEQGRILDSLATQLSELAIFGRVEKGIGDSR